MAERAEPRMRVLWLGLTALCLASAPSLAANRVVSRELNLIGGYSDRERWIGAGGPDLKNSVGAEYYERFAHAGGDFLTANLQVRLSYDAVERAPRAWSLDIHNAWLEYRLGLGRTVKVGHYDPAFGLEPLLDTHATILQTLAHHNIGYKKDWGIAFRGFAGDFDYTASLQTGSGMSLQRRNGSFLATARIGTPPGGEVEWGLSVMTGRILQLDGMRTFPRPEPLSERTIEKHRAGLDAQVSFGPWRLMAETAYGRDERAPVLGAMSQLDHTVPGRQELQLHLQGIYWNRDLHSSAAEHLAAGVGISLQLDRRWTVRSAYLHDLRQAQGMEDWRIIAQLYYFAN